jgi:acyl-CoA synthetase (NDP forming)
MNGNQTGFLLEPEAIRILQTYGIPYPNHSVAHSAEEAVEIAHRLGSPVVLKVVSPNVIHKSDVGGIALGLENARGVREAYDQILRAVGDHVTGAEIQGVLVCEQAPPGLEVIAGGLKDALFGPTVMFGLGGIFVEVLKDVSFRVAPLKRRDAEEMIHEVQGYPLLAGVRGRTACDVSALVDLLNSVAHLMMDRPDISELDLNPVRVYGHGLLALDVRVRTGGIGEPG